MWRFDSPYSCSLLNVLVHKRQVFFRSFLRPVRPLPGIEFTAVRPRLWGRFLGNWSYLPVSGIPLSLPPAARYALFGDLSSLGFVYFLSLPDKWFSQLGAFTSYFRVNGFFVVRYKFLRASDYMVAYPLIRIARAATYILGMRVLFTLVKDPSILLSGTDWAFLKFYLNSFFLQQFPYLGVVNPREFYLLTYYSFKWLDFRWIFRLLQRSIGKLVIFKHKSFLLFFLRYILRDFAPLFKKFNVRGFFLSVRGKIGVSGNARRRRIFLNINQSSRFNLAHKVYHYRDTFNTLSGALGFQLWVFYV